MSRNQQQGFSGAIVICLVIILQLVKGYNGALFAEKTPPILISTHDIELQEGENKTVFIYPSEAFNETIWNLTTSSLSLYFKYSVPDIIYPLPNITIADAESRGFVFKNQSINIISHYTGRTLVTNELNLNANLSNSSELTSNIFLRVTVYKWTVLNIVSTYVGWIYFFAWSISFYPQIYQNWRRKSVRGLSLEFVYLNLTGHAVYGVFNIGLYWIKFIQEEYLHEYPTGLIPVKLNDVFFSIHATFACTILTIHCLIYDRGSQSFSKTGRTLLTGILVFIFVLFIVTAFGATKWLLFLTICSYIKLLITLIKYIPQAYLNYSRKSTSGWSIGNVLLDFTGGVLSITQMFLISYNNNDWTTIFGDFTKFGLGLVSVLFDILFIFQHYVFYRNHTEYEPIEGGTNTTFEHNEDLVTSTHHYQQDDQDPADSYTSTNSSSTN